MIGSLGCRLDFLTLLVPEGFGLGDRFLQRGDMGFQRRNLLGRCLGLVASLLAQDLGRGDPFLQCSVAE
jgi:hypothetical protein